jgi:hypothetical protein
MIGVAARAVVLALVILAGGLAHGTATRLEIADITGEGSAVVEVLNGCGSRGIADRVCELLIARGFDVMFVGNADDFLYDRTLVVDRVGDRSKAIAIAEALGAGAVISQQNNASFVEMTVVLGKDMTTVASWLPR